MKFGQDDESPLNQLIDELDIQSATNRLTSVGFKVLFSSNERHHLTRPRGEGQEDIFSRVEDHNHFVSSTPLLRRQRRHNLVGRMGRVCQAARAQSNAPEVRGTGE